MNDISIKKNFLYKLVLLGFNSIFPLLILPYVYRVLLPDVVGLVEYGLTLHNYFLLFGALGIYIYGLREISKVRDNKIEVDKIYTNLFVIGVVSNIITICMYLIYVYCLIGPVNKLFPILLLYGLNLLSNIFYTEWYFEANENFKFITIKTIIVRSLQFILILFLVNQKADYLIYVLLLVLTIFINNMISFMVLNKRVKIKLEYLNVRKYLRPLLIVFLLQNCNLFFTQIDRTLLGYFVGNESVAFYVVGQKLVTFLFTILMALTYVSIPRLSFYLENNYEQYKELLFKLSRTIFCFIIPAAIGLFLLSEEVVLIYAGKEYLNASIVLKIFSIRMVFMALENIYANQILFLHKKESFTVVVFFIIGLFNVVFKMMIGDKLTPEIAISLTFILELIALIIFLQYVKRKMDPDIKILSKYHVRYFLLSVTFIPIVIGIRFLFDSNYLYSTCISVFLCVSLYLSGLIYLKDQVVFGYYLKTREIFKI